MESKKYITCGGCGATHPKDRCIGCLHPFTADEEKEQVKKGVAIIEHGSPNEEDDQLKFSIERGDLWKQRAISAELELEELKKKPGAVWVKASERLPEADGYYCFKANGGYMGAYLRTASNGSRWFSDSAGGTIRNWKNCEWLDESAAGREEIERRNKLIEDNLKLNCRLNMPGIGEQEQECAWAAYKLKHNL